MTWEMRSFTVAWRKWWVLKAPIWPLALSLTSGLTPHLSSPSAPMPSFTSQTPHRIEQFSTALQRHLRDGLDYGLQVALTTPVHISPPAQFSHEYYSSVIWVHRLLSPGILWRAKEEGKLLITFDWRLPFACVSVGGWVVVHFFFNRASGLNWVNWHLAIRSDSPALCGSVYGSKISSVRLSAWAVVLLEVLTPLLAGISARGVNGNTKKSIVRCRVGREEKKFCSKQLKLAQTEIFGDLTSQQQQWDRGGSSHCTDGPGFTLSFQNHRCPHSVVAFCFSLWTCPVDAIFNCLWVSFIRGWHYLGFVPHFDLRFATDLLVLCVWGTASFSGDTEPIGAMGSHPCCQWWDWGTERAVHSAVSLDRGGLATLTRRSTIVENGLRELWRESRLFFFRSDSPYLPWARLINTCEAFARKVPRSSL